MLLLQKKNCATSFFGVLQKRAWLKGIGSRYGLGKIQMLGVWGAREKGAVFDEVVKDEVVRDGVVVGLRVSLLLYINSQ